MLKLHKARLNKAYRISEISDLSLLLTLASKGLKKGSELRVLNRTLFNSTLYVMSGKLVMSLRSSEASCILVEADFDE